MIADRPKAYHLAWHRLYVADADRYLVYVLVPAWLGVFGGSVDFEAISFCGRPLDKVGATMKDLASPRQMDDTEGFGHPVELKLIRALAVRATQAGHILPAVEPTTRFRGWARLVLTQNQRNKLLVAGGVAPGSFP